jgi:hypothetical protein
VIVTISEKRQKKLRRKTNSEKLQTLETSEFCANGKLSWISWKHSKESTQLTAWSATGLSSKARIDSNLKLDHTQLRFSQIHQIWDQMDLALKYPSPARKAPQCRSHSNQVLARNFATALKFESQLDLEYYWYCNWNLPHELNCFCSCETHSVIRPRRSRRWMHANKFSVSWDHADDCTQAESILLDTSRPRIVTPGRSISVGKRTN